MSSFNLVQIVPSLNSGRGRGTVDVANFLAEKKLKFYYHLWW